MGFLKELFKNSKKEKIASVKFNPNDNGFGENLLKYIYERLSRDISTPIKIRWIKKEDTLPLITITKGMDEIQKLYETKIVSFSFDIWADNVTVRDSISTEVFNLIKNLKLNRLKMDLSEPGILNFEEKSGIYRCQFDLTIRARVDVDRKKLISIKNPQERDKYLERLVLGNSSFGGKLLESKDKKYALFNPSNLKEL